MRELSTLTPVKGAGGTVTYLVLVCCAHTLHDLLGSGLSDSALLGQDLGQGVVDLARHVRGITADVEVGLLQQQLTNLLCMLL